MRYVDTHLLILLPLAFFASAALPMFWRVAVPGVVLTVFLFSQLFFKRRDFEAYVRVITGLFLIAIGGFVQVWWTAKAGL